MSTRPNLACNANTRPEPYICMDKPVKVNVGEFRPLHGDLTDLVPKRTLPLSERAPFEGGERLGCAAQEKTQGTSRRNEFAVTQQHPTFFPRVKNFSGGSRDAVIKESLTTRFVSQSGATCKDSLTVALRHASARNPCILRNSCRRDTGICWKWSFGDYFAHVLRHS